SKPLKLRLLTLIALKIHPITLTEVVEAVAAVAVVLTLSVKCATSMDTMPPFATTSSRRTTSLPFHWMTQLPISLLFSPWLCPKACTFNNWM
ncbi:hypothetical protein A2U01_0004153, partial [Trifolium medium]|nr:hypothetical protein [Trifolium medium]